MKIQIFCDLFPEYFIIPEYSVMTILPVKIVHIETLGISWKIQMMMMNRAVKLCNLECCEQYLGWCKIFVNTTILEDKAIKALFGANINNFLCNLPNIALFCTLPITNAL